MFSDKGATVGLPRRWSSTKTGMDTSWDVTPRIDEAACLDDTGQKTYKSPPIPQNVLYSADRVACVWADVRNRRND